MMNKDFHRKQMILPQIGRQQTPQYGHKASMEPVQ